MVNNACLGGVLMLVLAACNTPPPQPWLRFQPSGSHDWTVGADGLLVARFHGADVTLDLNRTQTRVQVTVRNATGAPIEMRMGPEGSSPRGAIGEVLLRALDGPPGAGGPDTLPYNSMQAIVVESGWRGTFFLDEPLGRDPVLGQYIVLRVEGRNREGTAERRRLPLMAMNTGTMPPAGT